MDTIKVKSFPTIDEVVDSAVGLLDKDIYGTVAFIGYYDTISTILGILLDGYSLDIGFVHIDEFSYDDLYELFIDENYIVSVEPIKDSDGSYHLNDADIQFVDDEVSTRYIRTLEDNNVKYEVFSVVEDNEYVDNASERDSTKDDDNVSLDYKDTDNIIIMCTKYTDLTDDEKQLFDLMLDWALW